MLARLVGFNQPVQHIVRDAFGRVGATLCHPLLRGGVDCRRGADRRGGRRNPLARAGKPFRSSPDAGTAPYSRGREANRGWSAMKFYARTVRPNSFGLAIFSLGLLFTAGVVAPARAQFFFPFFDNRPSTPPRADRAAAPSPLRRRHRSTSAGKLGRIIRSRDLQTAAPTRPAQAPNCPKTRRRRSRRGLRRPMSRNCCGCRRSWGRSPSWKAFASNRRR